MDDIPISVLFGALFLLIILSAFFSSSETGMMAINRYRLRHMAANKHRAATRVSRLLSRPDRLIGVILLGNNFVNIFASSIATIIAIRLMGDAGIPVAALLLTIVILIFSEVAPKTLAALHPERIAFPASFVIEPLLRVFYPLVWLVNLIGNALLRIIGVATNHSDADHSLNTDELRTVVYEARKMLPPRHRQMLLGILDLENVTVDDIMVPRHEIVGIDLNETIGNISEQLINSHHTRLPLYEENINGVVGVVHLRKILRLLRRGELTHDALKSAARDAYFIPAGTPLYTQLLNFQRQKRRIGLVVDEYGDIQGLTTLEDILEEVVGEFTTSTDTLSRSVHKQEDGSVIVDAGITIRELNKAMNSFLPTDGPKTLNGLILEYLEEIPEGDVCLKLNDYPIEILQIAENSIKTVRLSHELWKTVNKQKAD